MYITEYLTFNEKTKVAVRGVMMYREKRDLSEKRVGKVLAIYVVVYRSFPKRSQRKNIWRKLCWEELRYIHVENTEYFIKEDLIKLGKIDSHIFDFEVKALRRKLKGSQKQVFDSFYYEKKNKSYYERKGN